jgi:hypothetical protein
VKTVEPYEKAYCINYWIGIDLVDVVVLLRRAASLRIQQILMAF